jgi:hypothetical protein
MLYALLSNVNDWGVLDTVFGSPLSLKFGKLHWAYKNKGSKEKCRMIT